MEGRHPAPGQVLTGTEILVVEDEFYLARELKAMIESAGGRVAGPFPDGRSAVARIADRRPDCAVIDVNLEEGISYVAADTLVERAIPFIFLTGYDAASLPARFAAVGRVEKPADLARLLEALQMLAGPTTAQPAAR